MVAYGFDTKNSKTNFLDLLIFQKNLIDQQQEFIAKLLEIKNGRLESQTKNHLRSKWRQNRKKQHIIVASLALTAISAILLTTMLLTKIRKLQHSEINPNTSVFWNGHPVYRRDNWGGQPPEKDDDISLSHPVNLVIVSHSATNVCDKFSHCAKIVQNIQKRDFNDLNKPDIDTNFLIGGDGAIYDARGWDRTNFQRKDSVIVTLIGNFNFDSFSERMINATKDLLEYGLKENILTREYQLVGQNQTSILYFVSPGENAFREIKTWNHFYNDIL